MSRTTTTTMTVRLSGALSDFVAANVGEHERMHQIDRFREDFGA